MIDNSKIREGLVFEGPSYYLRDESLSVYQVLYVWDNISIVLDLYTNLILSRSVSALTYLDDCNELMEVIHEV